MRPELARPTCVATKVAPQVTFPTKSPEIHWMVPGERKQIFELRTCNLVHNRTCLNSKMFAGDNKLYEGPALELLEHLRTRNFPVRANDSITGHDFLPCRSSKANPVP